jgi:hypothetical protein
MDSPAEIASFGHTGRQASHEVQLSSIINAISGLLMLRMQDR